MVTEMPKAMLACVEAVLNVEFKRVTECAVSIKAICSFSFGRCKSGSCSIRMEPRSSPSLTVGEEDIRNGARQGQFVAGRRGFPWRSPGFAPHLLNSGTSNAFGSSESSVPVKPFRGFVDHLSEVSDWDQVLRSAPIPFQSTEVCQFLTLSGCGAFP
jgi:hypothetical protein